MPKPGFVPLDFTPLSDRDSLIGASVFRAAMAKRRTVRDFSDRAVAREVIENALMTAASAPSGANQQPWTFVCISDPERKARIRAAAEVEEKAFYEGRVGKEWLEALGPLGTDW
jgi:iodotyrosine deiodinase